MKLNITYELMPGDKVYLVTQDGMVLTIFLKPEHFDLVHDRLRYPITDSALFETDERVYYLGSKTFKDTDKRIPLKSFSKVKGYNNEDRFEEAKASLKNTREYDYVYTTLEQAQEVAKNKEIEIVKSKISSTIKFIVVVNTETNVPISAYTNIASYSQYSDTLSKIKKLEKKYSLTTTIGLEDGRTFELSEFESYVANLIENLSIELDRSNAKKRKLDSGNEIILSSEYDEQTQRTVNKMLKHLHNVISVTENL